MAKSLGYRVARQFAQALDEGNYPTAQSLLASDCVYDSPSGTLCGPEAIIDSYRNNSEKAHGWFENIEYDSQVIESDDTSATILFIDHLTHSTGKHTYRCQQKITLDSDHLIIKIDHREIEVERRALEGFLTRCGIKL